MRFNTIWWSVLAGIPIYVYFSWFCAECAAPRDAWRQFRNSLGFIALSLALAALLIAPWAAYQGWALADVIAGDVPFRKMRTAIYAVYAFTSAGFLGVVHAATVAIALKGQRIGS